MQCTDLYSAIVPKL